MKIQKGFFAYASEPAEVGATIERAVDNYKKLSESKAITTWKALDIVGHFIAGEVLAGIDSADFLVADITELNFNVTYEIGYAIGQSKRVLLVKNRSYDPQGLKISEVGIFDTIGFKEYQNANELSSFLESVSTIKALDISAVLNVKAPVYILDTPNKTDWSTRIISRVKKAAFIFRNFDPNELPRLSAFDAISQVAQSYGVIVPLLAARATGSAIHNMRAAFIAGLANGMKKAVSILQSADDPVPLDYRDFVEVTCKHPTNTP